MLSTTSATTALSATENRRYWRNCRSDSRGRPSSAPTGDTVFFPAGRYLVSSGLTVPPALTLQGTGWNTPGSQVNTFAGSWIFVEAGAGFSPVTIAGSGGAVRDLAFNVPDQSTNGAPASAQPMLRITANNALVEDVCLYNPYGGVYIDWGANGHPSCLWPAGRVRDRDRPFAGHQLC